ncbi:hypothetical protein LCGC14_0734240 [marine sediment metagenome]|uniref:Uncharacterized protein n=1 Tax=marine sediment metagenome TaxID=412755 RepID=A0A0F9QTN6_9ZZZZ
MALTKTPQGSNLTYHLFTESATPLTAVENVRGGPCTLYAIGIENEASSGAAAWVKAFDHAGAGLSVGTDDLQLLIPIDAQGGSPLNDELEILIPGGLSLVNGLTFFASKEDGSEAAVAPSQNLTTRWMTN